MNCSSCGVAAVAPPQGRTARCLNCGKPLGPAPLGGPAPPAPAPSRHSYTTPFGKLLAQAQKAGGWVAVSYIAVPDCRKETAAQLVGNLLASWRELTLPSLPKLQSFDEKQLRCTWALPKVAHAAPLSARRQPLRQAEVMGLIRALAVQLDQLHQAGLGAFDLSPSVIFLPPDVEQATFVPTPWLASLALWSPGAAKDIPSVAPDLGQARQACPDPARADLYALGALAWHLLTGGQRKQSPAALPGEHSPDLAPWDLFIDGCCRSNPARRFESVAAALQALEAASYPAQQRAAPRSPAATSTQPALATESPDEAVVPPAASPVPRRAARRTHRLLWLAGLAVACVLALGVFLRREQLASYFPSMSGLLVPYRRGFGDTVLEYADCSYEGRSWKKLKEAESLGEVARITSERSAVRLMRVIGWDDDTFWVTGDYWLDGLVFRCRNGHWSLQARLESIKYPTARPLGPDTLFVASRYDVEGDGRKAFVLSPRGVSDHGKLWGCEEICPLAPDLVYYFRRQHFPLLKVASGERTLMETDKYREASVHREDNTPLKEYEVNDIRLTRVYAPGKAVGIARAIFKDHKVARFKDGIWYALGDLPRKELADAWLHGAGSPHTLVVVGEKGFVLAHTFGGSNVELSVPAGQEATSTDLIKVWGVNPDRFWVMDRSGTVWERKGADWRVVVRGMYRDDVKFKDAWVSPRGTVVAVTEKHVYRLD